MDRFVKQNLSVCIYIVFVLCVLVSCSSESNQSTLEEPQKYLSLNPAITETIFYLEGQEQLLGRSDYCKTPEEADKLPSFGTALTPNYKAIARVHPKSIFTDVSSGTQLDSLEQLAPVIQLPWLSIDDIQGSVIKLGELLDKKEQASALAAEIQNTFLPALEAESLSLLMLMEGSDIQKGQLWFMKKGSLHGAAIEAAGFRNGAPDLLNGPPSMSLEQLIKQDPDMIVFLASKSIASDTKEQLSRSLDIMPMLKAVQKKRVGVIDGENLMGVGPSAIHLVEKIRSEGKRLLGTE